MKRFWKSTEYYLTVIVVALLAWQARSAPYCIVAACVVLDSYIIGRTLWKKNRGLTYSGALTSEFQAVLAAQILTAYGVRFCGLPYKIAMELLVANLVIYNLCRGIAKSVGVKNHFR